MKIKVWNLYEGAGSVVFYEMGNRFFKGMDFYGVEIGA